MSEGSVKREYLNLTPSDFSSLKKVDEDSFSAFRDFYAYKRLDKPIFFHSVLEMIGLGGFYYAVIGDCLVVFRVKKMYGNVSCIVYFSPISLTNDVNVEQVVFASLLRAGFSLRLTESEIKRLSVNPSVLNLKADTFQDDYIYDLNKVIEMQGSDFHDIRCRVRKFSKEGGVVERGFSSDVIDFVIAWAKARKVTGLYNRFLSFLSRVNLECLYMTRLYIRGVLQGFSVIESIGLYYANVIGILNPNSTFDLAPGLAYHEALGLPDQNTLIAAGSGVRSGLGSQKLRLRPVAVEAVYRVPALSSVSSAYSLVQEFLV